MKKLFFLPLCSILLIVSSCIKPGCTDSEASNYDPDANDEDKSCVYQSSVVFWFDEETSNYLTDNGVINLQYFFNSNFLSGGAATSYSAELMPDCGAVGTITTDMEMVVSSKTYSYKVMDFEDYVWWSGTVELKANECVRVKLEL